MNKHNSYLLLQWLLPCLWWPLVCSIWHTWYSGLDCEVSLRDSDRLRISTCYWLIHFRLIISSYWAPTPPPPTFSSSHFLSTGKQHGSWVDRAQQQSLGTCSTVHFSSRGTGQSQLSLRWQPLATQFTTFNLPLCRCCSLPSPRLASSPPLHPYFCTFNEPSSLTTCSWLFGGVS